MIYNIYSIRDHWTGYMPPTYDVNDASAMRNFRHAMMVGDSVFVTHKEDFSLYRLGTFNTETGEINIEETGVLIDSGLNGKEHN